MVRKISDKFNQNGLMRKISSKTGNKRVALALISTLTSSGCLKKEEETKGSNKEESVGDLDNLINDSKNPKNNGMNLKDENSNLMNEFNKALKWMHNSGIIIDETYEKYRPFETISRENAIKYFIRFSKLIDSNYNNSVDCDFKNIYKEDDEIINACRIGLFENLYNNNLNLERTLSLKEAYIFLVKILLGEQIENKNPRWKEYIIEAHDELGILGSPELEKPDRNVTRYELSLILYRAMKYYKGNNEYINLKKENSEELEKKLDNIL